MPEITKQNVKTKINEVKLKGFTEKFWKDHFTGMKKADVVLKNIKSLSSVGVNAKGMLPGMKNAAKAKTFYTNLKRSVVVFHKANTKKNDPVYKVCKAYMDITDLQVGKINMHLEAIAANGDDDIIIDAPEVVEVDETALLKRLRSLNKKVNSSKTVCKAFCDRVQTFAASAEEGMAGISSSTADTETKRAALAALDFKAALKALAIDGEKRTREVIKLGSKVPRADGVSDDARTKIGSIQARLTQQSNKLAVSVNTVSAVRTQYKMLEASLSGKPAVSFAVAKKTLLEQRTKLSTYKALCDALSDRVQSMLASAERLIDTVLASEMSNADKLVALQTNEVFADLKRIGVTGETRTRELLAVEAAIPNITGIDHPKLTELYSTVQRRLSKLTASVATNIVSIEAVRTRYKTTCRALK